MLRPRSVILVAAAVASLLACTTPGTRGTPSPALGPYVVARTNVAPPVRVQATPVQEVRGGALMLHDSRRMCDLKGSHGSC